MTDEKETSPKDELTAALAHLRSAADLIAKRIDPAVRKAATDAERAMERVASETERTANEIGAAAKPFASKVGAELGKLADEIKKSVAQLEHAGAKDAPTADKTPDPDDPSTLR
jgi:hypothetical protein